MRVWLNLWLVFILVFCRTSHGHSELCSPDKEAKENNIFVELIGVQNLLRPVSSENVWKFVGYHGTAYENIEPILGSNLRPTEYWSGSNSEGFRNPTWDGTYVSQNPKVAAGYIEGRKTTPLLEVFVPQDTPIFDFQTPLDQPEAETMVRAIKEKYTNGYIIKGRISHDSAPDHTESIISPKVKTQVVKSQYQYNPVTMAFKETPAIPQEVPQNDYTVTPVSKIQSGKTSTKITPTTPTTLKTLSNSGLALGNAGIGIALNAGRLRDAIKKGDAAEITAGAVGVGSSVVSATGTVVPPASSKFKMLQKSGLVAGTLATGADAGMRIENAVKNPNSENIVGAITGSVATATTGGIALGASIGKIGLGAATKGVAGVGLALGIADTINTCVSKTGSSSACTQAIVTTSMTGVGTGLLVFPATAPLGVLTLIATGFVQLFVNGIGGEEAHHQVPAGLSNTLQDTMNTLISNVDSKKRDYGNGVSMKIVLMNLTPDTLIYQETHQNSGKDDNDKHTSPFKSIIPPQDGSWAFYAKRDGAAYGVARSFRFKIGSESTEFIVGVGVPHGTGSHSGVYISELGATSMEIAAEKAFTGNHGLLEASHKIGAYTMKAMITDTTTAAVYIFVEQDQTGGSYTSTCSSCQTTSKELNCKCKNGNGNEVSSTLIFSESCFSTQALMNIFNDNGKLKCPEIAGSYVHSCSNCKLNNDSLTCNCKTSNGSDRETILDLITTCGNTPRSLHQIANIDGFLSCPTIVGSFSDSCENCKVNAGVLSCSCLSSTGIKNNTSLHILKSCYSIWSMVNIDNINGQLSCREIAGSYLNSCFDCKETSGTLMCSCKRHDGQRKEASLILADSCFSPWAKASISNVDGELICPVIAGPFINSCSNCVINDYTLSCACSDGSGLVSKVSTLVVDCSLSSAQKIEYKNGHLICLD